MPTVRDFDLDGLTFRVHTSEHAGSEHTFLLVHGIGISHRLFARLHAVLAGRYTVHTVDLPGFGGLPEPGWSPDVPAMTERLGRLMDQLGVARLVAVGDSMGTQWAVELGVQRPDFVTHVVAIGPVVDDERRTALAQAIALGADTLREPPSANALVLTEYLRAGPRWYLRQLPHMLAYRIEDRVAELRRPLLILRGRRDPIAGRDWCARLRQRARRARMVEVPGHPHLVQHTAPQAVANALQWFVEEADA